MMQNIVVSRKTLVLILATSLLVFRMHGSTYGQNNPSSTKNLFSAAQIREMSLPSIVFIDAGKRVGSGVLIDKNPRIVLTNQHVTRDNDNVKVLFPAYDSKGRLIQERSFYVEPSILKKLGYVTSGRVVAEDRETDVAIVILEGLPATAAPIKWEKDYDYSRMKMGEPTHILGNPDNRNFLWQWAAGHFQKHEGERLTIAASVYYGNSGGPVLNQLGVLIGLAQATDFETKTYVVPLEPIIDLVGAMEPLRIFSITSDTEFTVVYEIKWSESEEWSDEYSLKPDKTETHGEKTLSPQGYPKIQYTEGTDLQSDRLPKDGAESRDNKTPPENMPPRTKRVHVLKTKLQYFGLDRDERIRKEDGYQYRFKYDSQQKKIDLREPRQTVYIANNTEGAVSYEILWTLGSREEVTVLQPNQVLLHSLEKSPAEEIPDNYPRIRFNNMKPTDVIDKETDTTIHLRHSTDQKLKTVIQFFNIDLKEDIIDVTDVKEQVSIKVEDNHYYFGSHSVYPSLIDLHPGLISTAASNRRDWSGWIPIFVVSIIVIGVVVVAKIFPERHMFSIQNNTEATVDYQVKLIEDEPWKPHSLKPNKELTRYYTGSLKKVPQGYPKVRFDFIVNDTTETKEHTLETYTRRFGPKAARKISRGDAREYHFELDSETKILALVDSEKSD